MIINKVIKLASHTKNVGLTNKFNYKSCVKNTICGDKVKLELIVKKSKVNSMRYETESCIFCEASASLLSIKIRNLKIETIIRDLNILKKILKISKYC